MPRFPRTSRPQPSATTTFWADGIKPASRLIESIVSALLGTVSAFILVGTHRLSGTLGGVSVPWGLIFGAVFQLFASIFLLAWFGRKLPLGVLALVFAAFAMWFAGPSAGGGILMPGEIAGQFQWQGWAVQLIGVLIPAAVLASVWVRQITRLFRAGSGEGPRDTINGPV